MLDSFFSYLDVFLMFDIFFDMFSPPFVSSDPQPQGSLPASFTLACFVGSQMMRCVRCVLLLGLSRTGIFFAQPFFDAKNELVSWQLPLRIPWVSRFFAFHSLEEEAHPPGRGNFSTGLDTKLLYTHIQYLL